MQWSLPQIRCYHVCRFICNHHLKASLLLEKGLCSYFVKTVMFWISEEESDHFWHDSSLKDLVAHFWRVMKGMLIDRNLPNYFISSNNMISTFRDKHISELLLLLNTTVTEYLANWETSLNLYINSKIGQDKQFTKSVDYSAQCKNYIYKIVSFCMQIYCATQHNHKSLMRVIASLPKFDDPLIVKYVEVSMNECLAHYMMNDAFEPKHYNQRISLLQDAALLLVNTPLYPDELISDRGMSRLVLLGFMQYIHGDHEQALPILKEALKLQVSLGKSWENSQYPIMLAGSKRRAFNRPSPPVYLDNDILGLVFLFDNSPEYVSLDSSALCLYLLFRISRDMVFMKLLQVIESPFPLLETTERLKKIVSISDKKHLFKFKDSKSFDKCASVLIRDLPKTYQ